MEKCNPNCFQKFQTVYVMEMRAIERVHLEKYFIVGRKEMIQRALTPLMAPCWEHEEAINMNENAVHVHWKA